MKRRLLYGILGLPILMSCSSQKCYYFEEEFVCDDTLFKHHTLLDFVFPNV